MSMTPERFVSVLLDLDIVSSVRLDSLLDSLPSESREGRLEAIVRGLIDRKWLTRFQARKILASEGSDLLLGNYLLCDRIGAGSMGQVFRAKHRRMDRIVAVKVLEPGSDDGDQHYRRFLREVRTAARLAHPNIVTAHDADESGGRCYLVMEYVEGVDLMTAVRRDGPLPVAKAIDCLLQAARGLQHAHSHGLVHRDVKPANLLLADNGVVKLLDLGLARLTDREKRSEESGSLDGSSPGRLVGTVDYMSPEQAEDPRAADRRSDIYSLGATLCYLLTAEPPYPREHWWGVLVAHRTERIPDLRRTRPDVPAGLQSLFEKMVAKHPDDRFATMADLIAALAPFAEEAEFEMREEASDGDQASADSNETRVLALDGMTEASVDRRRGSEAGTAEADRTVSPPGLDFGASRFVVVRFGADGVPRPVPFRDKTAALPALLYVDKQRRAVLGNDALDGARNDSRHAVRDPLGMLLDDSFPRPIYGSAVPPTVWVGLALRGIVDALASELPTDRFTVAVPNLLDELGRGAFQTAGYLAGLPQIELANRSTCLIVGWSAEAERAGEAPLRTGEVVLTFDLGARCCDLGLFRRDGETYRAIGLGGDLRLGSDLWHARLADHAAREFLKRFGDDPHEDPETWNELLASAERAKRALSRDAETVVTVEHAGRSLDVTIPRTLFKRLTQDLTDRTASVVDELLERAGLEWSGVDRVILVGGGGRMSLIRRLLAQRWGREPIVPPFAEAAVAIGAAWLADDARRRRAGEEIVERVTEVTPHALAHVVSDPDSGRSETRVLIPRGSPLPAVCRRTFRTLRPGQRRLNLLLVEGDGSERGGSVPLGRLSIDELPEGLPVGSAIELTLAYRKDGRLAVSYAVGGRVGVPRLERARGLGATERSLWRGRIEGGTVFDSEEIGFADER
ncbi:MAG TPA: Hsp70 family protein [Pirellulaceae bacterium]|nr:Hsp70 family protein [Pirellulaceae bacterium]